MLQKFSIYLFLFAQITCHIMSYQAPIATHKSEFSQHTKAIFRRQTQLDPTVTPLRPAGGSESTHPAGRPSYLPSLHVTSGETNLDCQTFTVSSLANKLPGWVHASQVIMLQLLAILLLSTVTQPATNSYALLGDPDGHTTTNPAAEVDTSRLI